MIASLALAGISLLLASIPAFTFARNLKHFARLSAYDVIADARCPMSVMIPARNEQDSIRNSVESILASQGVDFELIVLDDHSTDATAAIVEEISRTDRRLRIESAPTLPRGWCGKQHACHVLAALATHDMLIWMDADVRLSSDALARIVDEMQRRSVGLLSGFPHQETKSWLEILLIPLIHFVLLCYLPLGLMRISNSPALGAGCGQLFIARRRAYEAAGGHEAIRFSLHDGIALPRSFRRANQTTDLFDASDLAECRMYRSAKDVWLGLLKNAGEGMASLRGIVPWTCLLAGGQVLPTVIGLWLITVRPASVMAVWALAISLIATCLGFAIRFVAAARYRQPWLGALVHPVGIAILVMIQWHSLILNLLGKKRIWKGRTYE